MLINIKFGSIYFVYLDQIHQLTTKRVYLVKLLKYEKQIINKNKQFPRYSSN